MEDSNSQSNSSEQPKEEPKIDDVLKKMEISSGAPEGEEKDAAGDTQLEKLKGVLSEADAQAQEKTQVTRHKTQEKKGEEPIQEDPKEQAQEEVKSKLPATEKKDIEFSENVQKLDQIIKNYKKAD